jgi:hypothetical protein
MPFTMPDEDLNRLRTVLEEAGKFSDTISKILNAARVLGAIVVVCVGGCITSILWVNAKAASIDKLEAWTAQADLDRKEMIKEWTMWRSDIEKVLAKLSTNQEMVIRLQGQQADLIARHLDKP